VNRQGTMANPRGGIEWTHILGSRTGYTSNPVSGCQHACRWRMPDGNLAICYAEATAERFPGARYKKGFGSLGFWPSELEAIRKLKAPAAGIFIDSMSDLFGKNVPREWIDQVIQTIVDCPQHVFFSLTKNASRLREFTTHHPNPLPAGRGEGESKNRGLSGAPWPANWLVGISAPPTFMFGKELSLAQQVVWFRRALEFLRDCPAQRRWVSIEPLSFDVSQIIGQCDTHLDWAVIGAATNGAQEFQPTEKNLVRALEALNARNVPVFMKGNLSRGFVKVCGSEWREEFPTVIRSGQLAEETK